MKANTVSEGEYFQLLRSRMVRVLNVLRLCTIAKLTYPVFN